MNYNICEECNQKYCGWAESTECQECGGRLLKITREEFYPEKKETAIKQQIGRYGYKGGSI